MRFPYLNRSRLIGATLFTVFVVGVYSALQFRTSTSENQPLAQVVTQSCSCSPNSGNPFECYDWFSRQRGVCDVDNKTWEQCCCLPEGGDTLPGIGHGDPLRCCKGLWATLTSGNICRPGMYCGDGTVQTAAEKVDFLAGAPQGMRAIDLGDETCDNGFPFNGTVGQNCQTSCRLCPPSPGYPNGGAPLVAGANGQGVCPTTSLAAPQPPSSSSSAPSSTPSSAPILVTSSTSFSQSSTSQCISSRAACPIASTDPCNSGPGAPYCCPTGSWICVPDGAPAMSWDSWCPVPACTSSSSTSSSVSSAKSCTSDTDCRVVNDCNQCVFVMNTTTCVNNCDQYACTNGSCARVNEVVSCAGSPLCSSSSSSMGGNASSVQSVQFSSIASSAQKSTNSSCVSADAVQSCWNACVNNQDCVTCYGIPECASGQGGYATAYSFCQPLWSACNAQCKSCTPTSSSTSTFSSTSSSTRSTVSNSLSSCNPLVVDPLSQQPRMRITYTTVDTTDTGDVVQPVTYINGPASTDELSVPLVIVQSGQWFNLSDVTTHANIVSTTPFAGPQLTYGGNRFTINPSPSGWGAFDGTYRTFYGTIEVEGATLNDIYCRRDMPIWYCPEREHDGTYSAPDDDEVYVQNGIGYFFLHAKNVTNENGRTDFFNINMTKNTNSSTSMSNPCGQSSSTVINTSSSSSRLSTSSSSRSTGCTSDQDCPIGICLNGSCFPCTDDTQCSAGQACINGNCVPRSSSSSSSSIFLFAQSSSSIFFTQSSSSTFVVLNSSSRSNNGCLFDSQCLSDQCVGGRCACLSNDDCYPYEECIDGLCIPAEHTACQPDLTCAPIPGPGVDECNVDFGCSATFHTTCTGTSCQVLPGPGSINCTADTDCGKSQSSFSTSVLSCLFDSQCPTGRCVDGECRSCIFDAECPAGYVCTNNACVPSRSSQATIVLNGCSTDAQCTSGRCINGSCYPCVTDNECAFGRCINNACQIPTLTAAASLCGNGVLEPPEECDDSNTRNGDGCTSTCLSEIGICGDGIVQKLLGEQCESSTHNHNLPYTCEHCRFVSTSCGNGALDPGEECDDGPKNSTKADAKCRPDCSRSRCGDGVVDTGEFCDDGNRINTDGCDNTCHSTLTQPNTQVASLFTSQNITFPSQNSTQPLPFQLPLAQLQPLIQNHAPSGDTGPAAIAVLGAGAASGIAWVRRRRRKR